jgi:hypothetical protein
MNWGTRIAIGYGVFVVFILSLVVMAFQQDFDLVADNYYEQEIAYQGRIDQMTNAKNDGQSVDIIKSEANVQLAFSNAAKDVKVHIFRPSDDTKDIVMEEASVDSYITVPTDQFIPGKYLVKVEWKVNEQTYYQEQTLFMN